MCGIAGISNNEDAAVLNCRMLHALQHRGQEAAGIVSREVSPKGVHFYSHKAPGLVGDSFSEEGGVIKTLHGDAALGHVRYSTVGPKHTSLASQVSDAQPFIREDIALVHNGTLTNAQKLREELTSEGARFETNVDSEVILKLVGRGTADTFIERLINALNRIEGAYALILLSRKKLVGVCDPLGIRPLILGKVNDSYMFASESCAFDIVKGEVVQEVSPGEIVVIENDTIMRHRFSDMVEPRRCVFEYIYFSRPDSEWDGENMYLARSRLGSQLGREDIERDEDDTFFGDDLIVVPVLDSGMPSAIGYAHKTHSRLSPALVRNHYAVGRAFIEPTESKRDLKVLLKHNVNKSLVEGKRVVLVDDSAVRGTTSKLIVKLLRKSGAKEVHLRIASAPIMYACHHGIDTHDGELLARGCRSIEEADKRLLEASGADSVAYLSRANMLRAVRGSTKCDACFSGNYPTPVSVP